MYGHLQGVREQYFVQLLNWIPLMYVRCVFVQYAGVRPLTAQTHNERTSTESNLVTAQSTAHEPSEDGRTYELKHVGAVLCAVTESNLVTAQSTAHEPPEDGRTYGPKHVGATSLQCF